MAELDRDPSFSYSEPSPGVLRVRLGGEIDLSAVRKLPEEIELLLAKQESAVVVDLSDVTFMDTSGVALLVKIANRVGPVQIEGATPLVARAIDALGLSEHLGLSPVKESTRSFPGEIESAGAARRFVAAALDGLPGDVVELAQLLTSELATNALVHTSGGFDVAIRLTPSANRLRIGVSDASGAQPVLVHPRLTEAHGRGLQLVNSLSADWGVQPHPGGKTVWFELHTSPPTS